MAKKNRVIIILMICTIIISAVAVSFSAISKDDGNYDDSKFRQELVALYNEYDKNISEKQAKKDFGLKRLIVSNYNGKSYGAEKAVVDEKNNFALLQYNTVYDAKNAYEKIKSDGLIVDADSIAVLDSSSKGEMYPAGSNTVGTPTFISNYNMDYEDVIVAVIDTGVMFDHPDIKDRFYNYGYDFSPDAADNAYYDTNCVGEYYRHATLVSGIIADNTPDNVKILPYKAVAFGASFASASSIISSINDAVSRGADVISISLTTGSSQSAFNTAVKNAVAEGVCLCASAGNESKEVAYRYPSCCPGAITVSALNRNNEFASYSNYGSEVDFCAPGSGIVSTVPTTDGKGGYEEGSGTSFSTPYVSAVCADIKSMNKDLSRDEVYDIIKDFAVDYGEEGYDIYYGNGVPDISNIVYTDSQSYSYSLPQGTLDVFEARDYNADTQPWSRFASKLKTVNIDDTVERIGDYSFYNMQIASFNMADTYDDVGDYAFYGCCGLGNFSFGLNVNKIGIGAFRNIGEDFIISGYQNTIAQSYAQSENIEFNILGCKHNYIATIVDPTQTQDGYTEYKCCICSDTYIGEYIEPVLTESGKCGENLEYYLYDTGKLLIDGSGAMFDYSQIAAPWNEKAQSVKYVVLESGVDSVSPFAFSGCINLHEFRVNGEKFKVINGSLYNQDETSLICYVSQLNSDVYEMPQSVTDFNASAFINAQNVLSIIPNDNYTVENSIVYSSTGDIIMVLPSYDTNSVSVDNNITVKKYALILCNNITDFYAEASDIEFENYSVGYYFDGLLKKCSTVIHGVDGISAQEYALSNELEYASYNSGKCGENITWYYDISNRSLTLTGNGDMFAYNEKTSVPWYKYLSSVKSIVVDDSISSLSDYSFYGASSLSELTMPLSMKAPQNDSMWYSCSNIKTLNLTLGTGYMDDYENKDSGELFYKFTPWYLSRNSITSFSLDANVKSIGSYAFRNCLAIKSLTLNCCEYIGDFAFLACPKLVKFTNYSKTTQISDYALFSYSNMYEYYIYKMPVMYAYDDSTSKDYCVKLGAAFESIGCGHSRGYNYTEDLPTCCYDGYRKYVCIDCSQFVYEEFLEHSQNGHYVKGKVTNAKGLPIKDVELYIDDVLISKTNTQGYYIANEIKCGNYNAEIKKHNILLSSGTITVDESNTCGDIIISYGDYHKDGIINVKDFVYAVQHKFDDYRLFDIGKRVNNYFTVAEKYDEQSTPYMTSIRNIATENSDYHRTFIAVFKNPSEYDVVECGVIYGKNMSDEMLTLENVDKENSEGFKVKTKLFTSDEKEEKRFDYGSSSKTGTISTRFYIKYTNGVTQEIYYSEVSSYTYGE